MTGELKAVVCIGGAAGAGKSTLAAALSQRFGIPSVSFSDVLREDAAKRGLTPTRQVLQDLGQQRIADGWPDFVAALGDLLGWPPSQPAVIEGIRHKAALEHCKVMAEGTDLLFVYVDLDDELRSARLEVRANDRADPERHVIDQHAVEREIPELAAEADLVLTSDSIEAWVEAIQQALLTRERR